MPNTEAIYNIFPDAFKDVERLPEAQRKKLAGNVAATMSDHFPDDLRQLKEQLAEHNIRVGKLIGSGNLGLVFDLETADGRCVDSAVIRIEPQAVVGESDTPIVLRPLFKQESGYFQASVVPRAEAIPGGAKIGDLKATLAVLNTQDYLKHLSDVEVAQVMYLRKPDGDLMRYRDGTPVGVFVDINSVNTASDQLQVPLGNIETFIEANRLNREEVMASKVPAVEITHLQAQMRQVNDKVLDDLRAAGIGADSAKGAQWVDKIGPRTGRSVDPTE